MQNTNTFPQTVDLFLFMGQSNMAGRGVTNDEHPEKQPKVMAGAGYEYRMVSAPDRLCEINEEFGLHENRIDGIDDGDLKTGSLVASFVNTYFQGTGVPVIAVSVSKGGSQISQWQPEGAFLSDTITRLKETITFLESKHCHIRHKYMLWCQGESDGDMQKPALEYRQDFEKMFNAMLQEGIETCFLIRIGHYNGTEQYGYEEIMAAQDKLAQTNEHVIMVSTAFASMKARGLMKDAYHYYQEAYNEVGRCAGMNTAFYANTGRERITWNCLRDSLTAAAYTDLHYYDYIAQRNPMLNVQQYGICGTKIAGTDASAFCKRYKEMRPADIITVFGGVNDWGQKGSGGPSPLGTPADNTEETFYGALDCLCRGLKRKFPKAFILFITPLGNGSYSGSYVVENCFGLTVLDYTKAIQHVCQRYHIPVVDLSGESGISPYNVTQHDKYFVDGLHLNEAGHEVISYAIEDAIYREFSKNNRDS